MKKLLSISLLLISLFALSQDYDKYIPTVAWSTEVSNVVFLNTDTFSVDVTPLDFNEPGAFPLINGNYLMDNRGLRYEIIDTTSYPTITVVDVFDAGFAPFQGMTGIVYQSAGSGESYSIPNGMFEKLDEKAFDYGYRLDMNILWDAMVKYKIPADSIKFDTISGYAPTKYTSQDVSNIVTSAGIGIGGIISDNGDGTVDVSALEGNIKAENSNTGHNYIFSLDEKTGITLTAEATNYIYVDYNSGDPEILVSLTDLSNGHTIYNLGKCFYHGYGDVDIITSGLRMYDFNRRTQERLNLKYGLEFVSGAVVSEIYERYISITSGILYSGYNPDTTLNINTSTGDVFEYYYYDGTNWIPNDTTQIDNTQYNDTSSGLSELIANRYGVHWVYKGTNGTTYVLYGQGNYTEANAVAATRPVTLPEHIQNFAVIRAKIIIQKGDDVFYSIEQIEDGESSSYIGIKHNNTGDIQGGAVNDYVHTTTTEHDSLLNVLYHIADLTEDNLVKKGPDGLEDAIASENGNNLSIPAGGEYQVDGVDILNDIIDSIYEHRLDIDLNTGKDTTGIYHANRDALNLLSGTNTGDQDLSNYLLIDSLANYVSLFKQAGTSTIFKGLNTIEFENAYDSDEYVIQLNGRVSDTETAELFITEQDSDRITIYTPIDCEMSYLATGQICECSNVNIIPLEIAEGGYFDFSWNGGGTWYFPDGSTSTDAQPSRTLVDGGTVYLLADDVGGDYVLSDNNTNSDFIGNISDITNLAYVVSFYNCLLLEGDILNLVNLTYLAGFTNCPKLTLSGVFKFKVTRAYFSRCDLSELEVQYLLESLVLGGKSNGTADVSGTNAGANTAALAAIATLEGLGWTITYNTL